MQKANCLLCIALVILISIVVSATAQEGDVLLLNGNRYYIQTNPLEAYLAKNPGVIPKSDVVSSANWRGYIATWEVKNGLLVLTDIGILKSVTKEGESGFSTERRSVISEVFPRRKEVVADWYRGHVIVPDGKIVNYIHMGYASTYEKYIVLRVEHGAVVRQWHMDMNEFKQFRDAQFAAFKRTEEYRKALAEINADKTSTLTPKQNEEFLREFHSAEYMAMIFEDR